MLPIIDTTIMLFRKAIQLLMHTNAYGFFAEIIDHYRTLSDCKRKPFLKLNGCKRI